VNTDAEEIQSYYQFHAGIYDWTRWSFLFGRAELIRLARARTHPRRILEVGCGTGANLVRLARAFPSAEIVGLDGSAEMLRQALPKLARFGGRVTLRQEFYETPVSDGRPFDLIVASYCLSMINPGYIAALQLCREDLDSESGMLALVDFHGTPWPWFQTWMRHNHVRMDGQIHGALGECGFEDSGMRVKRAYGGAWEWLIGLCPAKSIR
jgi:S-adenosylmethionine-diacylgycerolhomoserine-N-methlytransferase